MVTDKQVEAAVDAWFSADPLLQLRSKRMRATLEAAEQAAWRPISEAPKDGTRVLVLTKGSMHSAIFDRIDNCWRVIPKTATRTVPVPGTPTHFRPLPKGPSDE